MKQHITQEQLNELTGLQKKRLGAFILNNSNYFVNKEVLEEK